MKKLVTLTMVMAMVALFAPLAPASAANVGVWDMNDTGTTVGSTVNNSGTYGDALDGTITGGALTKTNGYDYDAVTNPNDKAYDGFDGGEYISVAGNDVLNINDSYIQFDCYVKAPVIDTHNEYRYIASRGGNDGWNFFLSNYYNQIRLHVSSRDSSGTLHDANHTVAYTTNWDSNQWYRVGFRIECLANNEKKRTLYYSSNTTLTAVGTPATDTYTLGDTDVVMSIGNQGGHADRYFEGAIDQATYVPEPATMTLLLLGLPFALRRRR